MLSDVELALLVLGVIATLVFFGLLAVILNTQCTRRYVEQRDTYIMATFVFLSACFLSRSINLIFVFLPEHELTTCSSITSNVLPFSFFIASVTVNLNRWVHVTRICYMISNERKSRPLPAILLRNFLHLAVVAQLAFMCYGVREACFLTEADDGHKNEVSNAGDILKYFLEITTGVLILLYICVFFVLRSILRQFFILEYRAILP